ncbi:hypothetical protein mRhiFer1_008004 [Rhinolophus ferrumequinum]|uniref:Uncharacterized protein n=1 Tax=Rhinolophus ferrumequinum TaxID=59479 RepID=A0A671FK23_RHIFE|nr:protein SMIM45 [Rhinolophus ferrumequinum]KAF6339725.1 hypothetical protein mRhiFer1_008004 [Rhinolophus ferrumequinum]
MGLNLGAYAASVDFNQVPWGWVFVHHAFPSHTWPGCAGGGDPLICGVWQAASSATAQSGPGGWAQRRHRPRCSSLRSLRDQSPQWIPIRLLVSPSTGEDTEAQRGQTTCLRAHVLERGQARHSASFFKAEATAMPHFLDWFVPVYLVISVLILMGFGACIYYFEPGLQEAHKWRMQRPVVDRDLRKTLMVRDNLAFGGPEV